MASNTWDLLEGLSDTEMEEVLALATATSLTAGEVIFDLGDEAHRIFLVAEGLVKLTLPLSVGDRLVDAMVGERMPGHMVGWSGLIPPHHFTAKATAVEDGRILAIERRDLVDLFNGRPALGYRILSNAARIVGQRLQVFQTLWIREMQHVVRTRTA